MSAGLVIELSDENFHDEVFGNDEPLLVECCAEAAYSCRQISGITDDLAKEFEGKVKVGRLDVEANWQTAEAFDVRTVPTVLLFQHDHVVERIDGPKSREDYRQALYELIAQYWVI